MQQFDVIFEIFGRAVFEVAEVAEVKRPRNQKRWKFSNENLWKLDEIQNLASATSKMTSWPQWPRKRLGKFFQKLHFQNQWIKLRKMSYSSVSNNKYVRSLKCYNGLICARGHFMFEFFTFFFFIFVLAQRSFGKYKSSIHKKSQLSISHPGCSGLVFYS